jgi:hypothetical protein
MGYFSEITYAHLYWIKIYETHSLVWYDINLPIVPSIFAFAVLEPNLVLFLSLFLIGVLFLVVLVCLLCMCCAQCLLRVEDRAVDRKSGSFKRARAEEHRSSFVLRKASGLLPLHILFLSYNLHDNQVYF